jgi:hypothetical protein
MNNVYAKFERLRKAIAYRGLDPKSLDIDRFLYTLINRGITESKLNEVIWNVLKTLEPPGCQMSHCEHYGHQSAFCNCSKEEIPGKCKIHREFLKRRKKRGVKDVDLFLEAMKKKFKREVLPEISAEDIRSYPFWDKAKKLMELSFLKKWNHSRLEEMKKLLLIRKKEGNKNA